MRADLVVIEARALNLWPAHDPITAALQASIANIEAVMIAGRLRSGSTRSSTPTSTRSKSGYGSRANDSPTRSIPPVPSPAHDAASCARSCAGTFVAKSAPIMNNSRSSVSAPRAAAAESPQDHMLDW